MQLNFYPILSFELRRHQCAAIGGWAQPLPDLPTIRESGFPDYETYEWYGLFAPAKAPKEIVARLGQEVAKILKDPELRERMLVQGAELVGNSPEEFGRFVRAEMDKWGALARRINLRVD